jgi:hypothetical protein
MDHQAQVQQMLRGHTAAEFVKLPVEERNAVYKRYLVTEAIVQIEEGDDNDFFNPELADGVLLRQEYLVGYDEGGKQVAKEAREIYYRQNLFIVRSHWLCEFLVNTLADSRPFRVESLVRKIIVTVDLEHIHDSMGIPSSPEPRGKRKGTGTDNIEEVEPWAVRDLKQLLTFTNADWIGIDIRGGGALDGSDLSTQQKIKEISGVVKQLILQFPRQRLRIRKVSPTCAKYHDLKPYWTPPSTQAKQNLRNGRASFLELMQIQIEEWTRDVPDIITADYNWVSLLT